MKSNNRREIFLLRFDIGNDDRRRSSTASNDDEITIDALYRISIIVIATRVSFR